MAAIDARILIPLLVAASCLACGVKAHTPQGEPSATIAISSPTPAPTATPVDKEPYPAGAVGYAISWPQCGKPYPDQPFDFGIIGVTNGQAFTRNPCFAKEYRWAERGRYHPSIYMNLNYREADDNFSDRFTCGDASCRAYRYGWVAAGDAYQYARSLDAAAPVWWLDVQIVSDWSLDLALNAESIQGAADYLKANGIRVGISSTSFQWATVAGAAQHNLPVWDASATDADVAALFCAQGKDFGGGRSEQIAYVAGGFEVVLACGG